LAGTNHISGTAEDRMIKFWKQVIYIKSWTTWSRDLIKFWEINENMSETVQDRHIVAIEG